MRPARAAQDESGSAAPFAVGAIGLLLFVGAALSVVGAVFVAHRTAQSAADLIGALERRGLIERRTDPDNRRRMLISLTTEGRAFLDAYDPRVEELEEQMLAELGPEDRESFRTFLDTARRALS